MSTLPSFTINLTDIVPINQSGRDSDNKQTSGINPGDALPIVLSAGAAAVYSFDSSQPVTYSQSGVASVVSAQVSADGKTLTLTASSAGGYYFQNVSATFYFRALAEPAARFRHDPVIPDIGRPLK